MLSHGTMGTKIAPRPPCLPKASSAKEPAKAETKAPASKEPGTTDGFDEKKGAKPAAKKIESIWKDGNINSTDDWQKS